MKPKAYSYVRMSTDAQLKGDSFRRQTDLSKNYAKKHDLDLIEDFSLEDIGVSAFHGDNLSTGALGKFVDAIKAGKIPKGSYLLVESLDRLSRQKINSAMQLFLSIVNSGINIVTLSDAQTYRADECDLSKIITSLVIMSRANEESEIKSQRLAVAWTKKRASIKTKKLTRLCPAWLRLSADGSKFEVDKEKSNIVEFIFNEAISGKGSFLITKNLNLSNTAPLGKAKNWGQSYVTKILKSRSVLGEFQPHIISNGRRVPVGSPIRDYFPQIITEEHFLLASSIRRSRLKVTGGRRGPNQSNLFTHMLSCAYCGGSLRYINKGVGPKGGQYLRCINGVNGNGCTKKSWSYQDFETTVLTFVSELDIRSLATGAKHNREKIELESDLRSKQEKKLLLKETIERTYDQIAKQPTLEAFLLSKMADGQAELEQLKKAIEELEQKRAIFSQQAVSESELSQYIELFQSPKADGDRFALSAKFKEIVDRILVGVEGRQSNQKPTPAFRAIPKEGREQLLSYIKSRPSPASKAPYMIIVFRNGTTRQIVPDPINPRKIIRIIDVIPSSNAEAK